MEFGFIISAFFAGLASFLMPCTYPLIPSFLAFIIGENKSNRKGRRNIFINAFSFITGFALIFIFFGIVAGLIGNHLGQYRYILSRLSGLVIMLFGFILMDIIKIGPLKNSHKFKLPVFLKPGNPKSSLIVGSSLALGWSPCIGPILGSVLLLASTSETVIQGGLLLAVFSVGFGIPFILLAFIGERIKHLFIKKPTIINYLNCLGGVVLVIIGIVQLIDKMGYLTKYLNVFSFDLILNYL